MDATTSRGTSIPRLTEKEAGLRGGGLFGFMFQAFKGRSKGKPTTEPNKHKANRDQVSL